MIAVWGLLLFIIFYRLTISEKGIFFSGIDLTQSKSLKGISAIEIMMGHLGITTGSIVLYPNRKAGILFVGIFLLLSGYGLMTNLMANGGYFRQFLRKRLLVLLFPAYFIYLCRVLFMSVFGFADVGGGVMHILGSGFIRATNWYVFEAAALYLLFYLCFKFFRFQRALIMLTGAVVIFLAAAFYFKIDNPWYGSTLCFPCGIFYALYRQKAEAFLRSKLLLKAAIILLIVFISIFLFFMLGENSLWGNLIARNSASVFFVLGLIVLLQRFRLVNSVSLFLGEISYEIFLIHPGVIAILKRYVDNDIIYTYLCFGCTVLLAYILHIPIKILSQMLAGKNQWQKKEKIECD